MVTSAESCSLGNSSEAKLALNKKLIKFLEGGAWVARSSSNTLQMGSPCAGQGVEKRVLWHRDFTEKAGPNAAETGRGVIMTFLFATSNSRSRPSYTATTYRRNFGVLQFVISCVAGAPRGFSFYTYFRRPPTKMACTTGLGNIWKVIADLECDS